MEIKLASPSYRKARIFSKFLEHLAGHIRIEHSVKRQGDSETHTFKSAFTNDENKPEDLVVKFVTRF